MTSNTVTKKTFAVLLTMMMVGGPVPLVHAEQEPVKNETIQVIKGDLYTYEANNVTRLSLTDPEVADILDAKADKILLLGKKPGQTILFVWDNDGKHSVNITVVMDDLNTVKQRIDTILAKANLNQVTSEIDPLEGKVVLSGQVPKEEKANFGKLMEPFNDSVMNLVKDENSEELIQIDMQITELSTTLEKNMGIDWNQGLGKLTYAEKFPAGGWGTGSKDWFKIGQFDRTTAIVNTVNMLINEGKARDLSRPRILVTSGKEATINVGGEVPIKTTTASSAAGGTSQENISFKQYGVTLTVTPTIKNGRIDIVMNTQVTDVDKTTPVGSTAGADIAYKTRSAQTQLMLDDRQTVVFAGLIRYSDSEGVKRVPFLGKIPVVGALFRNRATNAPNETKELVITLTPTIIRKKEYATDQIKLPTKKLVDFDKEVMKTGQFEKEALPGVPEVKTAPTPTQENMMTTDYVRTMQQRIAQSISYPEEALADHSQGTVKLKLIVRRDGSLARADVEESSGKNVFDQDAINTAKMVAPYAKFPDGIMQEQLTVTIPIIYSQTAK